MNIKTLKDYTAFDIISLLTVLLDTNKQYDITYNQDNSQITITTKDKDND